MSAEIKTDNKKEADDSLLVQAYRDGDQSAADILLNKYKPMVLARARELYLAGGDQEDLLQEGMLGLFRAIREYDPGRDTAFLTYAWLLVSRQMYSAIEAAGRKKHQVLNQSVPISELEEGGGDLQLGAVRSPEDIFFSRENARTLLKRIEEKLSPMERQVLKLYLEGENYQQISTALGKPPKSIDNALQRIRSKVAALLTC